MKRERTATIISLLELAAIALYVESGIPLADCRVQVARQSVFFSMMRDTQAKATMIALAKSQQENDQCLRTAT